LYAAEFDRHGNVIMQLREPDANPCHGDCGYDLAASTTARCWNVFPTPVLCGDVQFDNARPIGSRVGCSGRVTRRDRRLQVKARQLLAGPGRAKTRKRLRNERAVPARAVLLLNQEDASVVGQTGGDARRVKAQECSQRECSGGFDKPWRSENYGRKICRTAHGAAVTLMSCSVPSNSSCSSAIETLTLKLSTRFTSRGTLRTTSDP
jgi:hypothetical protein